MAGPVPDPSAVDPQYHVTTNDSLGTVVGSCASVQNTFHVAERPVRWPVVVGQTPRPVTGLVDRRDRLVDALAESRRTGGRPVGLIGNGGVGKTELAAQEFRARQAAGAAVALWIRAGSRASVLAGFRSAAARLHLEVGDNDEENAALLLGWLQAADRPWVIVLDDVADPAEVFDLLPVGPAGVTLLTTRWNVSALDENAILVDIDVYTHAEATEYLHGRLRDRRRFAPHLLDAADDLARELGYLPLAVAHAMAVIVDEELTCGEYLARLRSRDHTLDELMPADPRAIGSGYPTSVLAAWSLALDRADARKPEGLARPLWEVISCLDPNEISADLLRADAVRSHLAARVGRDRPVSAGRVADALRNLTRLSLVQRLPEHAVRTHTLAQRVTRESLSAAALQQAGRVTADALAAAWPADQSPRALLEIQIGHVDAVRSACPAALWQPDAHAVLFGRGNLVGASGRAISAARYFAGLVRESATRLGDQHPDTLLARQYEAVWTGNAGDPKGAVALLDRLLNDKRDADTDVDLGLRGIRADFTGEAGDPEAAALQFAGILAELGRMPEAGRSEVLEARWGRAKWMGVGRNSHQALRELEALLAEARVTPEPDHEFLLKVRTAILEHREGVVPADRQLREWHGLVSDAVRELGPTHSEALAIRNRSVRAQRRLGTLVAAAEQQQRLYDDLVRILDPEDSRLLAAREDLARYKGYNEDPEQAVRLLEESLAERRRAGGSPNEIFEIRANLAGWRGRAGRPGVACQEYEELLADQRRVLGPDHHTTLMTRHQLIYWSEANGAARGELREALDALLADARRIVGEQHRATLHCRQAILTLRQLDGENVEQATEELLADVTAALGPDNWIALHLRANLWTERLARGEPAATEQLRRLIPEAEARLGPRHLLPRTIRQSLAARAAP